MCGIAGLVDPRSNGDELLARAAAMASTLTHRGPDGSGTWAETSAGVAFGHRRLRIIDLSEHGRQPMSSASGRYTLVYNGEIYNFRALRRELEGAGASFRGASDTEVLVEGIDRWGLDATLRKANGMFAFALWDQRERVLHLSRDRFGEKPLYYGWSGRTFLFASELKAFRADPAFRAEIDRGTLALYMRHGYVPGDHSIYQGVSKLLPGTTLTVTPAAGPDQPLRPVAFWSAAEVAEHAAGERLDVGDEEAADAVEAILGESVGLRMVADVPLGAFLSGGIDSSLIAALMQAQSSRPVRTFTIGFREAHYDESGYAQRVARHLGTDHTELTVTPSEALAVVPRLPQIYDEPFADSSQIPTLLLAELTRQHVTVSLSGDAGDELFGGYLRYKVYKRVARSAGRLPRPARILVGSLLRRSPPKGLGQKVRRLGRAMGNGPGSLYNAMVLHWDDAPGVVRDDSGATALLYDELRWPALRNAVDRVMCLDTLTYLPDDILTKVDRATMAASLEARVPFLDHRVYELAWRLPPRTKLRGGTGKWLLRRLLHRHVPAELVERPKMGFGVPIAQWLRGPLRPWAEDLLGSDRLRREDYLDAIPVRRKWEEHVVGTADWSYDLWNVLMFEAWLDATG